VGLLFCSAFSDERTGLNFTVQLLLGLARAVTLGVEVPQNSRPHFTVSFETPQPGGPGPSIYIPREQDGPVIPTGTGFHFCRLLRLAGLRWRYSNPSPHGLVSTLV
jgi:hypothetical protein